MRIRDYVETPPTNYQTLNPWCRSSVLIRLQWVRKGWDSVTTEVIVKSFKACGISTAPDGSEDGQIHCLNQGDVAADAMPEIARFTADMNAAETDDLAIPLPTLTRRMTKSWR